MLEFLTTDPMSVIEFMIFYPCQPVAFSHFHPLLAGSVVAACSPPLNCHQPPEYLTLGQVGQSQRHVPIAISQLHPIPLVNANAGLQKNFSTLGKISSSLRCCLTTSTFPHKPFHPGSPPSAAKMSERIDYVLYDSSLGYAVFQVTHQVDGVAMQSADYQKAMASLDQFGKTVKAVGFYPFRYVVMPPWLRN